MAQQIKIGVTAEAGGATKAVESVDRASEGLAESLKDVARQADAVDAKLTKAAKSAKDLADAAARIRSVQSILARELKGPIGEADARRFIENFDRARAGNGLGSQRLRSFDDFEGWYHGHTMTFRRQQDAHAHRMRVFAQGMQGTTWAGNNPPPAPPPGPAPSPGQHGGSGAPAPIPRMASSAFGFMKGALGLAGIATTVSGVFGAIGSGINYASTESDGLDLLRRRFGLRGDMSYSALQQATRGAGAGLGVSYLDSAYYASQYASEAGKIGPDIGERLRSAYGMSRALGLDVGQGALFAGTMARTGVATDDAGQRRLASLIADAIERGGFTAKADEVLRAVAEYSATAARTSYSAPNVGAYLASLSSLTATGAPGLDPTGAAGVLGHANAAMIGGGAMGDASKNLSYAALARGYDPVVAQSLWAGGIFGTPDSVFGMAGHRTFAGQWFAERGIAMPTGTGDNLSKVLGTLHSQYKNLPAWAYLSAVMGQFGLQTPQEAMALDWANSHRTELGGAGNLLKSVGVDITKLSNISGIADIAKVAQARSLSDLVGIFNETEGRKDLTDAEKARLTGIYSSGNLEGTKAALAQILADHGQAATPGSDTRAALVDIKDVLTDIGAKLLDPIDEIKEAVVGIYAKIAPQDYQDRYRAERDARTNWNHKIDAFPDGGWSSAERDRQVQAADQEYDEALKAGKTPDINKIAPAPSTLFSPDLYAIAQAKRQHVFSRYAKDFGGKASSDALAYLQSQGVDSAHALAMVANFMGESGLNPGATGDNNFWGNPTAFGIEQWHSDRRRAIEKHFGKKLTDMNLHEQLDAALWELRQGDEKGHGNAFFDADGSASDLAGMFTRTIERPAHPEYDAYQRGVMAEQLAKGTPVPGGGAGGVAAGGSPGAVHVTGSADVTIRDPHGNVLGTASPKLQQMPGPMPSGGGASGGW